MNEFKFITKIAASLYSPYVLENLPMTELRDALSDGQIYSKLWLVRELCMLINNRQMPAEPKIAIVGGWIGTLALMIHQLMSARVTSIDLDDRANKIAQAINNGHNLTTVTADMYDIDYMEFDVIINTSSEHIPNIGNWRNNLPPGKIAIVQNTNYRDAEGHISCVEKVEHLKTALDLSEVLFAGTLDLPIYKRFMVIGRT